MESKEDLEMRLLSTKEVCHLLGVSKITLYKWNGLADPVYGESKEIHNEFPRPFKIGRSYKWRLDEIMQWLEKLRVPTP